jgi:hypothetical protein
MLIKPRKTRKPRGKRPQFRVLSAFFRGLFYAKAVLPYRGALRGRCGGGAPAWGVAEAMPLSRQGWSEGGPPPPELAGANLLVY